MAWRAGWGFNIFVWTSIFRWFPVTPTYSHLCTVSSSIYSGYLHIQLCDQNSLSNGVRSQAFFDAVSINYFRQDGPYSRRLFLWSGVSNANRPLLWPKTLSPWAVDHEARWALFLTLSCLVNRASLCWALSAAWRSLSSWFLCLSLSLLSSDSISESYIQILSSFHEGSATKEISYTVGRNPIWNPIWNPVQKSNWKSRNPKLNSRNPLWNTKIQSEILKSWNPLWNPEIQSKNDLGYY